MSFYRELQEATAADRAAFLAIPAIGRACAEGVPQAMYLDFLGEAYHHVSQTCPLLSLAAAHCGPDDGAYREALYDYIAEERGHERWILDDIRAMGGDPEAVRQGAPRLPCRLMVAFVRDAIRETSPYAMLGMVHVLEGMSVLLAERAAGAIATRLGATRDGAGFSYLTSHGGLDVGHVAFFAALADGIERPEAQAAVIDTARVVYGLYGDLFRDVAERHAERTDAA